MQARLHTGIAAKLLREQLEIPYSWMSLKFWPVKSLTLTTTDFCWQVFANTDFSADLVLRFVMDLVMHIKHVILS